jgi:hypothetical protein
MIDFISQPGSVTRFALSGVVNAGRVQPRPRRVSWRPPAKVPPNGTTLWSSYRLAKKLGITQSSVSRVWRHFGIQPERLRGYMASDDHEFEEKAVDIIGKLSRCCARKSAGFDCRTSHAR